MNFHFRPLNLVEAQSNKFYMDMITLEASLVNADKFNGIFNQS